MGKYGKKNEISLNIMDYSICLCGVGGIGKTTLAKEVCEKVVGEDGYLHLNIGREQGVDAISNIVSEPVESWQKLVDIKDDIIENKDEDYPSLKVLIYDSYDELIKLAEAEAIRQYNKKNPDKKADSILSSWGGWGKGQDYASDLILNLMWELRAVGVRSFVIAHTKRSTIVDPVSQSEYTQLTADAQQRYFNALRNKMDIIAVGYIDREIVKEKTGRKNVVTKQDITVNKVTGESRVICFRDDQYSIDSKCRFSDIVDKIPFDSDEFITAIEYAIKAEQKKSGVSYSAAQKKQKETEKKEKAAASEYSKNARENKIDPERNEELIDKMGEAFGDMDVDAKAPIKTKMKELGLKNFKGLAEYPTAEVEEIAKLFNFDD